MSLFESVYDWLTARNPIFFYLLNYIHLDIFKILNLFNQSIIFSIRLLTFFQFVLLKYLCICGKHRCLVGKGHICPIEHLVFTIGSQVLQTNYIIAIFIISSHYWFGMINVWLGLVNFSHTWSAIAEVLSAWWSRIHVFLIFVEQLLLFLLFFHLFFHFELIRSLNAGFVISSDLFLKFKTLSFAIKWTSHHLLHHCDLFLLLFY